MQSLLFSFQGRVNRAKYWLVTLGVVVVEMIVFAVTLGAGAISNDPDAMAAALGGMGIVGLLLFIPLIWVSLAVAVKCWHDRNKSGWWILIVLVPVVGSLWYLIECGFLPGTSGPNRFGADPLGAV